MMTFRGVPDAAGLPVAAQPESASEAATASPGSQVRVKRVSAVFLIGISRDQGWRNHKGSRRDPAETIGR
jgi:hypothetical protein